jgi:DNA-binding NarL/FixJ family response regulator
MRKALVVEDFKLISEIWKTVLLEMGFERVEVINNSDDVEDYLLNFDPEIILMDINLPGVLNGIELSESIIKKDKHRKILILTIHTEPTYIQRAMEIGASGFITKNSSIPELKKAIAEILAGNTYICEEVVGKW